MMNAIFVSNIKKKHVSTIASFDQFLSICRDIFLKKNKDYGASWRVLRPPSLTDQILIKIARVRSIDEKGEQKVNDPIEEEFIGLINYSLMALIQLKHGSDIEEEWDIKKLASEYDEQVGAARDLLAKKNHDYGEIWKMMRLSSIIDIVYMKVHRIKKIEDNSGKTIISEGLDANYLDIINYCIFALIKLEER